MNKEDTLLFEKLTKPEQEQIRKLMAYLLAERQAFNKRIKDMCHRGYITCHFCGDENRCYTKGGFPRCAKCKREQEAP